MTASKKQVFTSYESNERNRQLSDGFLAADDKTSVLSGGQLSSAVVHTAASLSWKTAKEENIGYLRIPVNSTSGICDAQRRIPGRIIHASAIDRRLYIHCTLAKCD